jgi:putative membrane protein
VAGPTPPIESTPVALSADDAELETIGPMQTTETAATPHFDVKPGVADHYAWLRTRLALERTAMAWIRTSIALIGFGFTIVQFFQKLQTMQGSPAVAPRAPRYLGLALIGSGVLALCLSLLQYRRVVLYLYGAQFKAIAGINDRHDHTPLLATAILLLLIGVFAFLAVLFRIA